MVGIRETLTAEDLVLEITSCDSSARSSDDGKDSESYLGVQFTTRGAELVLHEGPRC